LVEKNPLGTPAPPIEWGEEAERAGKECGNHAIEDDDTLTAAYSAQVLD